MHREVKQFTNYSYKHLYITVDNPYEHDIMLILQFVSFQKYSKQDVWVKIKEGKTKQINLTSHQVPALC